MTETQTKAYNDFNIDDLDSFELDELVLASNKAEIMASNIDSIYDKTTDKTFWILGLLSTMFISSSTYFFINNDVNGVFNPKLFTILVISFFLFCVCIYLMQNIMSIDYMPLGSDPTVLINKVQYDNFKNKQDRIKSIYFTHLVNLKEQINVNDSYSFNRGQRINMSIYCILFTPIIGLFCYIVSNLP